MSVYMDYKKAAIHGLIMYGGVVEEPKQYYGIEVDYYSGAIVSSVKDTQQALNDIRKYQIDYENTPDPYNFTGSEFAGTDCDSLTINFVRLDLVLMNGTKYIFAAKNDKAESSQGFVETLKMIHEMTENSFEDVCNYLQNRLDKPKSNFGLGFGYSCVML